MDQNSINDLIREIIDEIDIHMINVSEQLNEIKNLVEIMPEEDKIDSKLIENIIYFSNHEINQENFDKLLLIIIKKQLINDEYITKVLRKNAEYASLYYNIHYYQSNHFRILPKFSFEWIYELQKRYYYKFSLKQLDYIKKLGIVLNNEMSLQDIIKYIQHNLYLCDINLLEKYILSNKFTNKENFEILISIFKHYHPVIINNYSIFYNSKMFKFFEDLIDIFSKNNLKIEGNICDLLINYTNVNKDIFLKNNYNKYIESNLESSNEMTIFENSTLTIFLRNLKKVFETRIHLNDADLEYIYTNTLNTFTCGIDFIKNILELIDDEDYSLNTIFILLKFYNNGLYLDFKKDEEIMKITLENKTITNYTAFHFLFEKLKTKKTIDEITNELIKLFDDEFYMKQLINDEPYFSDKIFKKFHIGYKVFEYLDLKFLLTEKVGLQNSKKLLDYMLFILNRYIIITDPNLHNIDDLNENIFNIIENIINNKILPDKISLKILINKQSNIRYYSNLLFSVKKYRNEIDKILNLFVNAGFIIDNEIIKVFIQNDYYFSGIKNTGILLNDEHYDIMHHKSNYMEEFIDLFENKNQIKFRTMFDSSKIYKTTKFGDKELKKIMCFKEKYNLVIDKYCIENKIRHCGIECFSSLCDELNIIPTTISDRIILTIYNTHIRKLLYNLYHKSE